MIHPMLHALPARWARSGAPLAAVIAWQAGSQMRWPKTKCNGCGTGIYQKTTGKTACTNCPVGRAEGELSTVQCPLCQAGTFAVTTGQTMCTRCPVGSLTGDKGATACSSCQDRLEDSSTLFQGADSPADCIWMMGSYKGDPLLGTNRCVKCTKGMLAMRLDKSSRNRTRVLQWHRQHVMTEAGWDTGNVS